MTVQPIRPTDIAEVKQRIFPEGVLEAFNEVIAKNFNGGRSHFRQDDVVRAIMDRLDISRARVFDERYLDVEDVYRAAGWKVEYDKPGYNEDYPATFTFRPRKED